MYFVAHRKPNLIIINQVHTMKYKILTEFAIGVNFGWYFSVIPQWVCELFNLRHQLFSIFYLFKTQKKHQIRFHFSLLFLARICKYSSVTVWRQSSVGVFNRMKSPIEELKISLIKLRTLFSFCCDICAFDLLIWFVENGRILLLL